MTTTAARPRPVTAASLGLAELPVRAGRGAGLSAYVRATLDAQVRVLLDEQDTAGRAEFPESVHRMRVATRRMRVALRLGSDALGPDWLGGDAPGLRADLGRLAGLLGPVRDLDVLSDRLGDDATTLPEGDLPAFGELLAVLLAGRTDAAATLAAGLRKPRYRTLLRSLAQHAAATEDGIDVAETDPAALLREPVRALHLHLAAAAESPGDAAWHSLRIKVKRVRYAAELAARVAGRDGGELAALAEQARAVQDTLGAFHDTVAAEDHLRALVTAHPGDLSPRAVLVAGRLVERRVAERDALRPTLPAACGPLYRATAHL